MPNQEILEKLEECYTIQDVENLFRNIKFPNSGNSYFFDEQISLIGSANILTNYYVKLDGLAELFFRIILYLKLSGEIGLIPQNSGEYLYAGRIHSFLKEIIKEKKISRIDDIDYVMLDAYIVEQIEKKGFKNSPVRRKILDFVEYKNYEIQLPQFLDINDELLSGSKQYKGLENKAKKEIVEKVSGIGTKITYPLSDLKVIIKNSIDYIENYAEDCLEAARIYNSAKKFSQSGKYGSIYDQLKNHKTNFTEPHLKSIQDKIRSTKTKYLNDGKKNLGRSVDVAMTSGLIHAVEKFEIACISIALMMTGMRVGELTTLDRRLNITQDEHVHLQRIVYKTAATKYGETLSMPIPKICKTALVLLSKLATIKDGKEDGNLILSAIENTSIQEVRTSRINQLLIRYCERLGLQESITPHQFRHAMAFLIVHIHENEGLELARMFLGHTSITMTLQYMSHYNNEIKEAMQELTQEESRHFVRKIEEQIFKNKHIFGENGKRLMPNHKFVGQQVDEFVKLMRKGLLELIKEEKLAIIQTPISLCMHDLSKPEDLVCQRGFNIVDIVANGPAPSRCKGANCSNAIFFEEHMEKLKENVYSDVDPELRDRLEKNTYFMEAGGFEQDPFKKLIKEYDDYKKGTA